MEDNKEDKAKQEKDDSGLQINKQTIDLLVANGIPTTKYFESRFDHMQYQIDELKHQISDFRGDVDKRFGQVDGRFDTMQSDMDRRFDKVMASIEKLGDKLDANITKLNEKIDFRDEKQRGFTFHMFSIAVSISVLGVLGVLSLDSLLLEKPGAKSAPFGQQSVKNSGWIV